jgi:hypothetical protein
VCSVLCTWRHGAQVSWLSLKTKVDGFLVWATKPASLFWSLGPQNHRDGFLVWASKSSRLRLVGCATKPMGGCFDVGHVLRSNSLLHLEASHARVSQSSLKTGGGAMTGGARGIITEVASSGS